MNIQKYSLQYDQTNRFYLFLIVTELLHFSLILLKSSIKKSLLFSNFVALHISDGSVFPDYLLL